MSDPDDVPAYCSHNYLADACPVISCRNTSKISLVPLTVVEGEPTTLKDLRAKQKKELLDLDSLHHQQVNAFILKSTEGLEAYLSKVDDEERRELFRVLRSRYCIHCGWRRPSPSDCCERCD